MNKILNFHTLTESLKLELVIQGVVTEENIKPIRKTIGKWQEIYSNENLKKSVIKTTELYQKAFVIDVKYPNESVLSSIGELAAKRQANLPKDALRMITVTEGLEPEFVLGLIMQTAAKAHSLEVGRVEDLNKAKGAIHKPIPSNTIEKTVDKFYKLMNYLLGRAEARINAFESAALDIRNKKMIPTVELYDPIPPSIKSKIERIVEREFAHVQKKPEVLQAAIKEAVKAARKINL